MKTERSSSRWVFVIMVVVALLMVANWVMAVARYQVDGLFSDLWSFYTPLFAEADWGSLFTWQHGPHRQGLAFVLTALVLEASGWDARVESLWVVSCLAAATGLAVWLKHRVVGRTGFSDTWIVLAGLSLLQYETVLLVPNASHSVFPLLLLLGACHLMVGEPARGRLIGVGVVGVMAMFTGFGLFVAAALLGYLGWQAVTLRTGRSGAWGGIGLMVMGGVWFGQAYVFSAASEGFHFPPDSWVASVSFGGLLVASRMGFESITAATALAGIGVGLLLVAAAGMALRQRAEEAQGARVMGTVMLAVGLGFMAFTTLGRVHLGEVGAIASRYTTLVVLLWWGTDMLVSGSGQPRLRRSVMLLGWVMALGPLFALTGRPVADWWGTAGLRDGDLVNLRAFEHRKLAWIAELKESGNWREAEMRVPQGIFPFVGSIDLDARLRWLDQNGRSFYRDEPSALSWLPWLPSDDVIWWRPRSGGTSRATPEGGRWFVAGKSEGYFNVAFPPSVGETVALAWQGRRGPLVGPAGSLSGISLRAAGQVTTLKLDGIQRAQLPEWSREPSFPIWSWSGDAWRPQRWLVIESGFHGWEQRGTHGWTRERLQARVAANVPGYINVVIESRFEPVADGEVIVRLGSVEAVVPWVGERAEFSVPVMTDTAGLTFELINRAGEKSPAELGMWEDSRPLAMRLARFSVDAEARYPKLDLN